MIKRTLCRDMVIASAVIALLSVSACGDTQGQRALSGGAIGSGVGMASAIILDANPLTGVLVGAAAGAATGALTNKNQINFGDIK